MLDAELGAGVVEVRTDELGAVVGAQDHRRLARLDLPLCQCSLQCPSGLSAGAGETDVVIHDHTVVHVQNRLHEEEVTSRQVV